MKNHHKTILGFSIISFILVICVCTGLALTGSYYFIHKSSGFQSTQAEFFPSQEITTSAGQETGIPNPTTTTTESAGLTSTPSQNLNLADGLQTLTTLQNINVAINDPIEIAERLQGKTNVSITLAAPLNPPKIGDQETFWASNQDTQQFFQVKATLQYIGNHLYFWIENGISFNPQDLIKLGDTFETIYSTDRAFFGSEWTPGIDDDVHLYALYTRNLGSSTAGYFSSQDEYPSEVFQYSNEHEMFDLNADVESISEPYIYSTMAHEFQHMIHWNLDRNEDVWMDEGFSVLAQSINGYTVGGFDTSFALDPGTQLNDWSLDSKSNAPHYGASFLYLDYILSRFGSTVTQAIVKSPLHGLQSIDHVMQDLGISDPQTNKITSADDIFSDWVIANFLQDPSIENGRYAYKNYPDAPKTFPTESIKSCPFSEQKDQVNQYGTEYIQISCLGNYTLSFSGSTTVPLVPVQAYSGTYDFWSNKGDQSDMTLTHTFDFTGTTGPVTLSYEAWYDLEQGYDFAYLEGSTDGNTWTIIDTPSCSSDNPSGNSYGCGYTGSSNHWIKESVDLSRYAGQKVQLRFEYLTDAALNGEGLLLDDISIPQIKYFTDFEANDGGWIADGFARVQNVLPQTFRISLIEEGNTTSVQYISLDANQSASIPISIGKDVEDIVLVVSGTTRFTRQPASYQITISP